MKKQFAVIGLGRFGSSVCKELCKLGHEVIAVDSMPGRVNSIKEFATHAAIANATDKSSLKKIGVGNCDHAVVAIGENLQASVLATLILKEIGIPAVWVKARDIQHQMVLEKVGADLVIQPEYEMGIRVAHHMDSEKIFDYIDLSENYSIIEWIASRKLIGRTLEELAIRAKYKCIILAIKRGENVNIVPEPNDTIKERDLLVIMGRNSDLKHFEKRFL